MSTDASTPYSWIKKIPHALAELDAIPLLGGPPPFPWENFTKALAQDLEIQNLVLEPSEFQWLDTKELLSGLGGQLIPLNFSLPPLEGVLTFAMTRQDIKDLMTELILKEEKKKDIVDEEFILAFYHFLALEAVHCLRNVDFDPDLSPQLIAQAELPKEPMLAMNITIKLAGHTALARLFISPQLRKAIAEHFSQKERQAPLSSPLSETIEVTLHLEGGSTTLSQKEWSAIKPGDFLLLEHCSLNPSKSKGEVKITYKGYPFFGGKIVDGKVQILEHPLYHEVTKQ